MTTPSSLVSSYGDHVPRDKNQRLVSTPYGEGLIVRTSSRNVEGQSIIVYEMELTNWKRAEGSHSKPATLFSTTKYPSVPVEAGCDVLCSFGRGRVVEVRPDNNMVGVVLSSWRLAQRSLVKCYLQAEKVHVVRKKLIYEMSIPEKIEYAQQLKQEASGQFASKDFEAALKTYSKAVDAVRYVQHKADSTNEMRADLLVMMITCSNNAATCAMQIENYENALSFANMALTLIEALEGKKGFKIHSLLNKEGFDDNKLFGEWKTKSLLVLSKACYKKQDTQDALDHLKKAHAIVNAHSSPSGPNKTMQAYSKDISKLYATCKEKRQMEKVKEKKRAQAMFQAPTSTGSNSDDDPDRVESAIDPLASQTETVKARDSASPTSVLDEQEYTKLSSDKAARNQSRKKRVSFSSDVKRTKEEAEDEFYMQLGFIGVGVALGAIVGGILLFNRPRSG